MGLVKQKAQHVTHIVPSVSKVDVVLVVRRKESRAERRRRKKLEAERESWKEKRVRALLNSDLSPDYDDFLG